MTVQSEIKLLTVTTHYKGYKNGASNHYNFNQQSLLLEQQPLIKKQVYKFFANFICTYFFLWLIFYSTQAHTDLLKWDSNSFIKIEFYLNGFTP